MASRALREPLGGVTRYQRFSELIFVSLLGHLAFAALYGIGLGQWAIALVLGGPALLVGALFPLVRTSLSERRMRAISHGVLLLNFAGLNLALMWMGLRPETSVWWQVWWPLFVALLLGVADGLVWLLLTLAAMVLIWLNAGHHWVAPHMPAQANPLLTMQIAFIVIGTGFGVVVRRAHDRYEADIEHSLQALQQASLDRTRLFAQISHEVRTPLNGLMGFAQLLGRTELSAQQARHVDQIQHCSGALLQIVNEMLDFSRLEARHTPLACQAFDPVQLAQEAIDMVSPLADHKGVTLVRETSPCAGTLMGDPLRIKQVLLNLLANALKFTPRGQVVVRCQTQPMADGREALMVVVQDSGIGIPADAMPHLFQPFSKASDATLAAYGGSGLGLAICQRLVDMMHGRIGVESTPGQGSRFWFEVPLKVA